MREEPGGNVVENSEDREEDGTENDGADYFPSHDF